MATPSDDLHFQIDIEHCGQRLDRVLTALLPDCSRSYLAQLIRSGVLVVNQQRRKPSYRLGLGDIITGRRPSDPAPVRYAPEAIPLDILHEDAFLIVLDKPAGLVVHPAPGHPSGTLVNALLAHCPELAQGEDPHRPGIVHRLDKDTSGVMVVAKERRVHESLAHQFKQRLVRSVVEFSDHEGIQVVAEGVETAREADTVVELGCHLLQGYFFGRPQPLDDEER